MTQDTHDARYIITAYDSDSITVNNTPKHESVIISASTVTTDTHLRTLDDLSEKKLSECLDFTPEILLIGTGSQPKRLSNDIKQYLTRRNIGFETMTTPAACRSYMALLSEYRNVAAILIL